MINIVDKCCEKASKGAFLHFLFALIKLHKFPVAKAKQEPTPAIFSSSESEIALKLSQKIISLSFLDFLSVVWEVLPIERLP